MPHWDSEVFSPQLATIALSPAGKKHYSRKSHFGLKSEDQLEQLRNLQGA
jgi:hypothetical protein